MLCDAQGRSGGVTGPKKTSSQKIDVNPPRGATHSLILIGNASASRGMVPKRDSA